MPNLPQYSVSRKKSLMLKRKNNRHRNKFMVTKEDSWREDKLGVWD